MNPWQINEISDMLDRMEQAKEKEEQYLIYVAEKNKNNCELCLENHGKRFKASDLNRPALPIHPNCHCHYEILDAESSKRVVVRSTTVKTENAPKTFGGIRVSGIDDMIKKLEKEYAPGTLSELIIVGHGEGAGNIEIGTRSRLEHITSEQAERLKRLFAPNAIVDVRMCYIIRDEEGKRAVQALADTLKCKVRAYANQVSPLGTRPFSPKNLHLPDNERVFAGPGEMIFYPSVF